MTRIFLTYIEQDVTNRQGYAEEHYPSMTIDHARPHNA